MFLIPADARSWVPGADGSDFPIQSLPYCSLDGDSLESVFVRIGDTFVDLEILQDAGLISADIAVWDSSAFALESAATRAELRETLYDLFCLDNPKLRDDLELQAEAFTSVEDAVLQLPFFIRQFVDFYSGIHHASNVGMMFRPDQPPLLPNYRHIPVGYNGRASSVVLDGEPITRPNGQTKGANDELPTWGPSKELDFELEMGFFTAGNNAMGEPIPMAQVDEHILGVVLVNDWSARDVQRWEYQPLGPFLAKSFATSITPYVVPLDALEPFRVAGATQDPAVLPYLQESGLSAYDIHLEVLIQSPKMSQPQVISASNARHLYWSFRQQLVHQASNGTPIEPGDLYGTGTISGPDAGSFGSLLELTWRGSKPITLTETGETRTFLEDGDTLIMRGWCQGDGYRIGLGEIVTTILPAPAYP